MQLNVVFEFGLFTRGKLQTQKIQPADDPHYRQLPLIDAVDKFPEVQHVKCLHSKYDDVWVVACESAKTLFDIETELGYFIPCPYKKKVIAAGVDNGHCTGRNALAFTADV